MIKKLFQNKFDLSQHTYLPPKASQIVHSVANEFMASNRSPKHQEMAHANLHMRLYQHFGHGSSEIVLNAEKMLHDMLGPKAAV